MLIISRIVITVKAYSVEEEDGTADKIAYTQPAKLDTTPAQLIDESINAVLSPVSDLLRRPILQSKQDNILAICINFVWDFVLNYDKYV